MSEQSELDKAVPGADAFLDALAGMTIIEQLAIVYPDEIAEFTRQMAAAGIKYAEFVGLPNHVEGVTPGFHVSAENGAHFFYHSPH